MKNIILCGIRTDESEHVFTSRMEELEALCKADDLKVVSKVMQKASSLHSKTAFREGKLHELAVSVQMHEADMVVFYNSLSPKISQRIAEVCNCKVIDKTAVILDIFAAHARSRPAKLQTEMARLQYELPYAMSHHKPQERMRGGGVTNRGSGEMQNSLIAGNYKKRIHNLQKELDRIQLQHHQDENRRTKLRIARAALVGYTNAGKSFLMNALLDYSDAKGMQVLEKDQLFATLDTSVRLIHDQNKSFLLYDTVGFVSDLPKDLLKAFETTLSAVKDADLLIHVIDSSDEEYEEKVQITEDTLKEIHADHIPVLKVYTKSDLLSDKRDGRFYVSSVTQEGIPAFIKEVIHRLYPHETILHCHIPYGQSGLLQSYTHAVTIQFLDNDETGMNVHIEGPESYLKVFQPYRKKEK